MLSLSCDLCDDDEDLKEGISVKWFRFRTDFLSFRLYLRLLLLLSNFFLGGSWVKNGN